MVYAGGWGRGEKVSLWNDKWLPTIEGCKLKNKPQFDACAEFMVQDIIKDGKWCLEEVANWLLPEEVEAIKLVHLPVTGGEDQQVWMHTKDGSFTLKSGYRVLRYASCVGDVNND